MSMEAEAEQVGPRRSRWLLAAVGPIVLIALVVNVGSTDLLAAVGRVDVALLLGAYALTVPAFVLRAARWRLLLPSRAEPMRWAEILAIYAYSIAVGSVTPGRIGEFVKLVHLRRRGASTGAALASTLTDRVFDVGFLVVAAVAGLLALGGVQDRVLAGWLLGGFVGGLAVTGWAVCGGGRRVLARLGALVPDRVRIRSATLADGLCAAVSELQVGGLLAAALLTIASWGVTYASTWLLALGLDLPLGYLELAGISALASLVTLLPISVLGAGTRDIALIVLLAPYGITRVDALALSLLFLSLSVVNALVCAPALFMRAARLDRSA